MIDLLALPFLACLVLTGIHAYLGLHVLARGVIFVDLALAQVAALGLTIALLAGHPPASPAAYWYALVFAVGGGLAFAVTRVRRGPIPQEAIIGIVYAVSAALTVLVVDRAPQGAEHVKRLLVGSLVTVSGGDVAALAALYSLVGLLHWLVRRPLLAISLGPVRVGPRVFAWDALFYASFAIVVTSSVRIAGVLLVFAYLVVPAAIAVLLTTRLGARLAVGWITGTLVSAAGLLASYRWDLPTGAAIVAAFGAALALTAAARGGRALGAALRARGAAALAPGAVGLAALVAIAGALLAVAPTLDHLWLDALELAVPAVQEAFLTPAERDARRDARAALERAARDLTQVRTIQQDAQWSARPSDPEVGERLRQYLAGRGELAAGDRLVLATLRARARERQRFWLGLPLAALGTVAAAVVSRRYVFAS
jgi:zinc/manganese transport system permease protein